jgi:ATP-dependent protease ClpP protease subunit
MNKIFELGKSLIALNFKDEDKADPASLMIYDEIGEDPWTGSGITAKAVRQAVALIDHPPGGYRELHCHINSPGGYCDEASAIRSTLTEYPGRIVEIIDGVSASAATWCIPADETRAFAHSQIFVHDAIGVCIGNAEDMLETMGKLDKTSDQIAEIYQAKTGKSKKHCRQLMKDETLMTGQEAYEAGFVDKIIEGRAVANFSTNQINSMKSMLSRQKNLAPEGSKKTNSNIIMNEDEMIALLNKWGVAIPKNATAGQLAGLVQAGPPVNNTAPVPAPAVPAPTAVPAPANTTPVSPALPQPDYQTLLNRVALLEAGNQKARTDLAKNRLEVLLNNDQLSQAEYDDALVLAADPTNGERYLASLEKRPQMTIGTTPLRNSVQIGDNCSFDDIVRLATKNVSFIHQFFGAGAHKTQNLDEHERKQWLKEVGAAAKETAVALNKGNRKQMIIDNWNWKPKNTTTIDPGLQRQVILMEMLEAFQPIMLQLRAFSTVFDNVPRMGTDTVDVPYYPLNTEVSNSWNPSVGYVGTSGVVNARPVYIGGSGLNSGQSAPAGYAKDRKWLALSFSSYELRAQPYVSWSKLASQKARKLAIDVFADIIGGVMTLANYGPPVLSLQAAQFDSNAITLLAEKANGLNWPETDRVLCLDHTYWTPLLQDPTFKQYLAAGTTETLRKQQISEAYGFEDIYRVPNFFSYAPGPNNAIRTQAAQEYLYGFIAWKYAMLIATAPIMPSEAVRALMVRYDLGVAPATGITLEYREFGDQVKDTETRVIECSYGAAPGVQTALGRIVSQGQ